MITIPQEFINKLSNQHEPRTKQASSMRIRRENQYRASNSELTNIDINIDLVSKDIGDDNE